MKFIKNHVHTFVGLLLLSCIVGIVGNACREGISVLVTQKNIDSTYKVNK